MFQHICSLTSPPSAQMDGIEELQKKSCSGYISSTEADMMTFCTHVVTPVSISPIGGSQADKLKVWLHGAQAAASAFDCRENRAWKAMVSLCTTKGEGGKEKRTWRRLPRSQGRGKDVWWILIHPERVQHIGVSRLWKAREEEGRWPHSRLLWSLDFSGLAESLTEKDPFIIPPSPPQTDVASSRCQDCMLHEARSCMCCLVPWCILIWKSTSKPF